MFFQPPNDAETVDEFLANRVIDESHDHLVFMVGEWRRMEMPEDMILGLLNYHDDLRSRRLEDPRN